MSNCPHCQCDRWLSSREVMDLLGVCEKTLYSKTKAADEVEWQAGMFPRAVRDGRNRKYSAWQLRQYQLALMEAA